MKKNREEFIEESKIVHGDLYDYSNVVYKSSKEKVIIVCSLHGQFQQTPQSHILQKAGCPKCSYNDRNKSRRLTQEEYLKRVKDINCEIDLSKAVFKHSDIKVTLGCHKIDKFGKEHGWYDQLPQDTFNGHGCPKCGKERTAKSHERSYVDIIKLCKEVHPEDDHSLIKDRINSSEKITPICKKHGKYEVYLGDYLNKGTGCPECYNEMRHFVLLSTKEEFVEKARKIHGDKIGFNKVIYDGNKTLVNLKCNVDESHGEFEREPCRILAGYGCPKCNPSNTSKQEKEILEFVKQYYPSVIGNTRSIISPKELDIYIDEIKVGIEFNGLYWHSDDKVDKDTHRIKTEMCERKGIHLIQIFEDDWRNKSNIIKSRLLNLFGKIQSKIFARQCEVREVEQSEGKKFLEENHLQGYSGFLIGYGLYFKDELVSLMTFGKRRVCLGKNISDDGDYELIRFASKINCNVIGSAQRLFKMFVNTHSPKKIVSYADRFWTMKNKNVYETLGFKFEDVTNPNYFYVINGIRKHRFGFRKGLLVSDGFDSSMSEREIMEKRGIPRIYNAGNLRYVWSLEK